MEKVIKKYTIKRINSSQARELLDNADTIEIEETSRARAFNKSLKLLSDDLKYGDLVDKEEDIVLETDDEAI